MKTKNLFQAAILTLAAVVATGCTTTLKHGELSGTTSVAKGPMAVSSRAENMRKRIGWGTLTVFAIPVAPVTVNGEPDRELMNQVKDAVEQSGHEAKIVENPSEAGDLPVLSCKVDKFSFRNYTWLFPIVFNWGKISMDVTVTGADGTILWQKSYTGKGNGAYSFNSPVNKALTRILNEMIGDLANVDFRSLGKQAQANPIGSE